MIVQLWGNLISLSEIVMVNKLTISIMGYPQHSSVAFTVIFKGGKELPLHRYIRDDELIKQTDKSRVMIFKKTDALSKDERLKVYPLEDGQRPSDDEMSLLEANATHERQKLIDLWQITIQSDRPIEVIA